MSIYGPLIKHFNIIGLSEAYIGKTSTLLEMEDAIGKIREKALKKFTDINKSPEVLAFNRLMEKQFGIDCYALYIEQSEGIDAYTNLIGTRLDITIKENLSDWVEGDKQNGYRWKDGNQFCIVTYITLGVLKNEIFTNEEIVAILLHELGHNFACAIYNDIKIANQKYVEEVKDFLIIKAIIAFGLKGTNKYYEKQGKKTRKNIFRGISTAFHGMKDDRKNFWRSVRNRLKGDSGYKEYKLALKSQGYDKEARLSLSRQNEVIADKFAAIYGYGPILISALFKLESIESKGEKFVKKIPFIGVDRNDSFNAATIDMYDYDSHPHNIQRANEEIALLKREIEKADVDPKLKKMMSVQITQIQNILKEETKVIQDGSKSAEAKELYYKYINGQCPMAVDEEIEDKIEDAFDEILNKK